MMIQNPILKGFYPDPSICRVDNDYYMVTSSFAFFPGVPVFHSRDLVHWEQLGHVLDRIDQLPLNSRHISGGIYAPTIRYHEGTFYMITTNVDGIGDFIVTADNPAGPWSEMHILEGVPGIDPSLMWDEDGTCYMCGNEWGAGGPVLWAAVLDTDTFTIGERHPLWGGALIGAHAPEAPHLYKKDGWYYLMIAEGGTEFYHAVTIARSRSVFGPYEGYRGNPILTHRHLGADFPISNVGHADLVETQDGSWYMVLLGSRLVDGHRILGRETWITPVVWEDGWPVVNPGKGMVEFTCPAPELPAHPFVPENPDNWHALCWNHLGTPDNLPVRIDGDRLYIRCVAAPLIPSPDEDPGYSLHAAGFYGRRQQDPSFIAECDVTLPPEAGVTCGMTVLQNDFASIRLELQHAGGMLFCRALCARKQLTERRHYAPDVPVTTQVLGETVLERRTAHLTIRAQGRIYTLSVNGQTMAMVDGGFMGSETCYGFIGAYIGLYASGNGIERGCEACFRNFHYQAQEDR